MTSSKSGVDGDQVSHVVVTQVLDGVAGGVEGVGLSLVGIDDAQFDVAALGLPALLAALPLAPSQPLTLAPDWPMGK